MTWEYASEERLAKRNAAYRTLVDGPNAEDIAFEAVAEVQPQRVLEVGCGIGDFAVRVKNELDLEEFIAIDLSPRMVELTAARGIDARVGDVQALAFDDESFDCVIAGWLLYHVPALEQAILECRRVLRPGGALVAATLGMDNFHDLWEMLGDSSRDQLSFCRENGLEVLSPYFEHVEMRDAQAMVVFPDSEAMRTLVAVNITHAHLADRVPEFSEPVSVRYSHAVFVARKAR
ncbi:MAG TPA: class I SAM-dependent methyltransferase [Gaiellaceae bacterium]|nr:class I SAM-dependent methyltransferase [Gaiellaceae bacterium]